MWSDTVILITHLQILPGAESRAANLNLTDADSHAFPQPHTESLPSYGKTILEISCPKFKKKKKGNQIHLCKREYWGHCQKTIVGNVLLCYTLKIKRCFMVLIFLFFSYSSCCFIKLECNLSLPPRWFIHSCVLILGKWFFLNMQIFLSTLLGFSLDNHRVHLMSSGILYMKIKRGNRKRCHVRMWFTSSESHSLARGHSNCFTEVYLCSYNQTE